jgi:hypothetical protein
VASIVAACACRNCRHVVLCRSNIELRGLSRGYAA